MFQLFPPLVGFLVTPTVSSNGVPTLPWTRVLPLPKGTLGVPGRVAAVFRKTEESVLCQDGYDFHLFAWELLCFFNDRMAVRRSSGPDWGGL